MRTKHFNIAAALALAATLTCSCASRDEITYFQDIEQIDPAQWSNTYQSSPLLRADDEIRIFVNAIDQTAVAAFNMPFFTDVNSRDLRANTQIEVQTYRIDSKGNINYPVLGTIHVADMTAEDLRDMLTERISAYVENPIVTVSLTSLSIAVMGEVSHPGMSYFGKNRATILEALTLRGDLTVYGDRTNVLLIREKNGVREYHRLDLTSAEVINSPYYYLQQDDVIYVSPNSTRRSSARYNSMKQQNLSMISTIVSVISVLSSLAIALWK